MDRDTRSKDQATVVTDQDQDMAADTVATVNHSTCSSLLGDRVVVWVPVALQPWASVVVS
jgi:hypothetical protein